MDANRAPELLTTERERIERGARLEHQDDGEPAEEYDPANLASVLYQKVLTQIEALGLELIEVRRACS
jgi:hypothetical protein